MQLINNNIHNTNATYLITERGLLLVADNLEELLYKVARQEIPFKRAAHASLALDHAEYYVEKGWFGGFCSDMFSLGLLVQPTAEQFKQYTAKWA